MTSSVIQPDSSPAGFTAQVTYTTPGGTVVVQTGGSNSFQINQTKLGQTGVIKGNFTITSSTDAAIPLTGGGDYEEFNSVVGLSYASFGVWSMAACANSDPNCNLPVYAGTTGGGRPNVTQTVSMPTTGTANYSGGAVGYVLQPSNINSNNAGQFYGTSSLSANFSTGAVTGSITGINAYDVDTGNVLLGTVNNIGLSATISGSTYSGTANVTGSTGTAFNIAGATGSVIGGFYGPTANETAGVFYLSGGANSTALMGSFGAKQPAPSDRRLKVEVETAGSLPNGLKLYGWRYLGGSHRFTGVMAQDLLGDPRFADAVLVDREGLMRVDYGKIGYLPSDFALMQEEGEEAVARYRKSLN